VADGFLGRWSQRKQAVREGKPLQEPVAPAAVGQSVNARGAEQGAPPVSAASSIEQAPPLTMQDAAALGADSDYAPFAARSVAPEVRNAAMKKLFTDPHYNLIDGLDTYIDDYSQPDPLPESMLRQMASAKFLKLFDEEPEVSGSTDPLPCAGLTGEPQSAPEPVPADSQPPAGNPT
jgi:hypothetical protein